jgi:WD40 repeat protein
MPGRSSSRAAAGAAILGIATLFIIVPLAAGAQEESAGEPGERIPIAVPGRDAPVDFEKEILPVFRRSCLACHNRAESKGGLVLETPRTILEGGRKGPVVVPGKGSESAIIAVASRSRRPVMPPRKNQVGAGPLASAELGLLALWIDQGAKGEVKASAPVEWRPLPAESSPIYAAAITPAGDLAACGRGDQVHIHGMADGSLAARLIDPALAALGYPPPGAAHADGVQALAFRPDGDVLASAGFRAVKLWRRPRGARRLELAGAAAPATAVAVSPAGDRAAVGTAAGKIVLWDLATGEAGRALAAHAAAVTGLAFSADGSRLSSSSLDRSIAAWDLAAGFPAARWGAPAPVNALAAAGKGGRLAAGLADGTLLVITLPDAGADGAPSPAVLSGHAKQVTALAAVPGEARVISGSEDGTVRVWDLDGGKEVRQLGHGAPVTAVAARADGKRFASAGPDGAVKVWKAEDGAEIAKLSGDPEARDLAERRKRAAAYLEGVAGAAKGALAAAETAVGEAEKKAAEAKAALEKLVAAQAEAAAKPEETAKSPADRKKAQRNAERERKEAENAAGDAALAVRSSAEARERSRAESDRVEAALAAARAELETAVKAAAEREKPVAAVAFASDGGVLLAAAADGSIHAWDAAGGAAGRIECGTAPPVAIIDVPGRGVLSASAGGAVLWDAHPAWPLERVLGSIEEPYTFADRVTALDWSPDGRLLATGGGEPSRTGELKVWRAEDWSLLASVADPHSDSVLGLEFSPDGRLIASAGADKWVKVWEAAGGKLVRSFEGHTHQVLGVSWRSDGKLLASAGADNAIKAWNLETGEQVRTIGGFGKQVTAIRFIPWSESVASSSGDGNVRFHNAGNGAGEKTLGAGDYLHALAVGAGGRLIAAGGHEGKLLIWSTVDGKRIHEIPPPR